MFSNRVLRVGLAGAAISLFVSAPIAASASTPIVKAQTTTYTPAKAFNPSSAAVNGSTDVYHCTLINPHLSSDRYVTSSQLLPDKIKEVHHAIYFLIGPDQVAKAQALNKNGNGWTCFGDPLNPNGQFGGTTWLGVWVPGHGANVAPADAGFRVPKGSEIVMQIHYNLLNGSKPDRSKVKLTTVPATDKKIQPMIIENLPAPPDLPCPTGVTGPLCDRTASLQDLGQRFGASAPQFVDGLEATCKHDPASVVPDAQGLVSTSCSFTMPADFYIRQVTPHMHLLGVASSVTLSHGGARMPVITVDHYNFDEQKSYTLKNPVKVSKGDTLTVSCTYNPKLRQRNPQLRKLPARYVTWGDGSSDEMCLAITSVTATK